MQIKVIGKKVIRLASGWFVIWRINVASIAILVVEVNKTWQMPMELDHHAWFTIAAYILIFILIYFYVKSSKKILLKSISPKHS